MMKRDGIFESSIEVKVITNGKKKVVFVPIHHIGKKQYYANIATTIDSLDQAGYATYYELVVNKTKDSLALDTLQRKLRHIMGYSLIKQGHLDTAKKEIAGGIKYQDDYELVNQPHVSKLGIDTATATRADMTLEGVVKEFEKAYGNVPLNTCDFSTHLDSAYSCTKRGSKLDRQFTEYGIRELRNKNLAKVIANADDMLITLMFGAGHFKKFVEELKVIDPIWEEIKVN